ncbi:hypothetical protein HK104_007114, partial [Borealophlyctis nickersoniae]
MSVSLSTIAEKPIFVLNRTSAYDKLENAGFSTAQKLAQLRYLHTIIVKANAEGRAMMNVLAEMLEGDKFGLKNRALDDKDLEEVIIYNPVVFGWFKDSYPEIADRMEAGLEERKSSRQITKPPPPPPSNDNKIHELRRQVQEMAARLQKKQKHITYNRHTTALLQKKQKRITYNRHTNKKRKVAEPEEHSAGEEDFLFYESDLEESGGSSDQGGPSTRPVDK